MDKVMVKVMVIDRGMVMDMFNFMVKVVDKGMEIVDMTPILYTGTMKSWSVSWTESFSWSRAGSWSWSESWRELR
jgi:hypothetical protein